MSAEWGEQGPEEGVINCLEEVTAQRVSWSQVGNEAKLSALDSRLGSLSEATSLLADTVCVMITHRQLRGERRPCLLLSASQAACILCYTPQLSPKAGGAESRWKQCTLHVCLCVPAAFISRDLTANLGCVRFAPFSSYFPILRCRDSYHL